MADRSSQILLVEDEPHDRELFAAALRRAHTALALQAVGNGQQAIDYLEGKGLYADRMKYPLPELIFLDLKMPGVSGFDFLAWHRDSPWATVPVIVLEGSGNLRDHEKASALGAKMTFEKPPDLDRLSFILKEISAGLMARSL